MNRNGLVWTTMTILLGWAPMAVAGQAPSGDPRVNLGVGVSATGGDDSGTNAVSPSVRVNFDPANGVAVSFDRDTGARSAFYTDMLDVSYRRVVHRFAEGNVAATAGVARTETYEHYISNYIYQGRPYEYQRLDRRTWATTGIEVHWNVTPYLTLQSAFRFGMTKDAPLFRVSTGVSVPLGAPLHRDRPAASSRPRDERLAGVRRGQTIWITTADNHHIKAEASSVSADRITFVQPNGSTTMALTNIRRIETTDHVRDGAFRGLAIGAAGGGIVGAFTCACEEYTILAVMAGVGIGSGIGTVAGLISDGLHEGRRTVYESRKPAPQVALAPLVGRDRAGIGGFWRW